MKAARLAFDESYYGALHLDCCYLTGMTTGVCAGRSILDSVWRIIGILVSKRENLAFLLLFCWWTLMDDD